MMLCGVCLDRVLDLGFFRRRDTRDRAPWLWLQEVTSTFFTYGIFIGARWRPGVTTISI